MYSAKMEQAINSQINAELYSAYLYYAMSAWSAGNDMPGMTNWFKIQALEELVHVDKFFGYINDRGGRVKLGAVEAPPVEWESALAVFAASLEHEKKVTGLINNLVNLATEEKDRTTESFLQWFVTEQIEEEATQHDLVGKLKLIGDSGAGRYMFDKELAARVFIPPVAA